MRILLVEDTASNALNISDFLRSEGHEVETFGSGEEAANRLDGPVTDAVILDVLLPGRYDGRQVARVMRTLGKWRNVPVVLMSGAPDELPGDRPYGGPTVSLAKPFDPPALLAAIQRAADMRG
jgi:CheY-like chemotaxis protein